MVYMIFFTGVSIVMNYSLNKSSVVWNVFYMSLIFSLIFMKSMFSISSNSFSQYYPFYFDWVSYNLMLISVLVILLSVLSSFSHVKFFFKAYQNLIMLMFLVLILFFLVDDMFLFFVFFELGLLPMVLIIGIWSGQVERIEANYYFFIYTVVSGIPLMVAIMYNVNKGSQTYFGILYNNGFEIVGSVLTLLVLFGFMCKLPVYSVHMWLPKAHVEAPVGSSMILASLLLKMSGYGMMRFFYSFEFSLSFSVNFMVFMCLVGSMFPMIICMRIADIKGLIAYSSVSHMSLSMLGLILSGCYSFEGAMFMFLAHSLVSPALFFSANVVYERMMSRNIMGLSSMSIYLSSVSMWFFLLCLMNFSFPPFVNFFSEMLIYFGVLSSNWMYMSMLSLSLLMSSVMMMNLYTKVFRSKLVISGVKKEDYREEFVLFVLIYGVIIMSVFLMYI